MSLAARNAIVVYVLVFCANPRNFGLLAQPIWRSQFTSMKNKLKLINAHVSDNWEKLAAMHLIHHQAWKKRIKTEKLVKKFVRGRNWRSTLVAPGHWPPAGPSNNLIMDMFMKFQYQIIYRTHRGKVQCLHYWWMWQQVRGLLSREYLEIWNERAPNRWLTSKIIWRDKKQLIRMWFL